MLRRASTLGEIAAQPSRSRRRAAGPAPRCSESAFPAFTRFRTRVLRVSRDRLAAQLAEVCCEVVDADLLCRIERHGQRPRLALLEALASVAGLPLTEIRDLFREVA